jgi:hypothetical protein
MHIPIALALPTWRARLVMLVSYPFWFDVAVGNVMVVMAVVAVYAVRGHRWAGWTFLTLTLLVPRPLMLPVAGWLLWRHRQYRVGFVALFTLHALAVLGTGWGVDWIASMLKEGWQVASSFNIGPTRVLGYWWLLAGIPLGLALFVRGHVGWAGLAISPYILPQYALIAWASASRDPSNDLHDGARRLSSRAGTLS